MNRSSVERDRSARAVFLSAPHHVLACTEDVGIRFAYKVRAMRAVFARRPARAKSWN
jgi:hypothetical protein